MLVLTSFAFIHWFVYITFLQGVSGFSLLIHLLHGWQNRTLRVWISFGPLGQLGTIGDSRLSALILCPQWLLGSTLLGGAGVREGNTKGRGQDSPALPSASWLRAHLGEPVLLASARRMPQTSSFMRRMNFQRAPRPQWLQLIGLYFVSGLLWYASLTLDHMVLFNEDPNLPNSQFKQRHLRKKSLNPTLVNFCLGKIKLFSAGWSGTAPGSATFTLLRPQHGSDRGQGHGATPRATQGAGLKPCRSVKKSQSWSFPSRVYQCGATCCCIGGWTGRAAFLRSTMGSPLPFYRVSRRRERKGLGSALPSAEGRYFAAQWNKLKCLQACCVRERWEWAYVCELWIKSVL